MDEMAIRSACFLLLALAAFPDVTHDRNLLDGRTVRQIREFQVEISLQPTQAHMGEDGTYVAGYTANGIAIYNTLTGKKVSEIDTGGEQPHDGAMSPDGRFYSVAFSSQDVGVYDLRTGKKIDAFQVDAGYA